mgnify:CR=1 FL=1
MAIHKKIMVLFLQSLWLSFCLFCLWFQGSSTAAFVYPNYPGHHSTPTPHSSTIRQQLNWQIPKSRNPLSSIENNQFARSQQPRRILPIILSSSTGAADESQELPDDQKDDTELVQEDANATLKFWERLQNYMIQRKENDGLNFKQRLAKMGLSTVLSYGMISNLSYAILVSLSWYGFAAKVC